MLRAYIDESMHEGHPPTFIMAGHLASAEQWANLATEWREILDISPRIRSFKLKEALRGTGQFYRMPEERRIERIALLRMCLEKNVQGEFGIAFRRDWFDEVFSIMGEMRGVLKNPYYYAYTVLVRELILGLHDYAAERQPIDLIFDNRVKEKVKILEGWRGAEHYPNKRDEWAMMRNPPSFQDDEEVLPLQAADMCATVLRLRVTEDFDERQLPGYRRSIRGKFFYLDRKEMFDNLSDFADFLKSDDDNTSPRSES